MTGTTVSSGVTSDHLTIGSDYEFTVVTVANGGATILTTVSSGGLEGVDSGGIALGTILSSVGGQEVLSGGTASGTTVNNSGAETDGGVTIDTVVNNGGTEIIGFNLPTLGGTASFTTVNDGGTEIVGGTPETGGDGTTTSTRVNSGGTEIVGVGGVTNATINNNGFEVVSGGGTTISTTVNGFGREVVSAGGTTISTTVNDFAREVVSVGGTANFTVVSFGGQQIASEGGVTSFTVLSVGGQQIVSSDGKALGTSVLAGGREFVSAGGKTISTVVNNGGKEIVSAGGTASNIVVSAGGTLVDNGDVLFTLPTNGGFAGTITGSGVIELEGSGTYVAQGDYSAFTGEVLINGGTLVLNSADAAGGAILTFTQNIDPTLQIDGSVMPKNLISGLAAGDQVVLPDVPFDSDAHVSSNMDGSVTFVEGGHAYTLNLAGNDFRLKSDGISGTIITTDNPCFRAGTRIRTLRGDVPVEALVVGDMVQGVRSGRVQEVVWIGYRRTNALGHPRPENVWPVCVRACAISDRVPSRDVWLSPEHGVFLHGVLVPVRHLINGVSIVQVPCREVVYYHVELPMHDLMLSEGLLSESYLDMGNRADFENAGALVNAHPAFGADAAEHIWRQRACAPQVRGGAELEVIRAGLMRQGQRMGAQLLAERG